MLQVVFGRFYRQIKKTHNNDVISCCWDLKISNFVKLNIGYDAANFQVSWLSELNFMEVSVRPPKHNCDVISYHCVFKLVYFVEHDIGYQPSKFECSRMSGSNFMEGGGSPPPPQCYNEIKSQLIGLSDYRVYKFNAIKHSI